jgi:hypothetical protein
LKGISNVEAISTWRYLSLYADGESLPSRQDIAKEDLLNILGLDASTLNGT